MKMNLFKSVMLGVVALASSVSVMAQTADEIADKHVAAIGGKDKWLKVTSMISEGSLQVQGTDVSISMIVLNGKGARQNISVMGQTGYTIMTPTAGWNYMPFQGQSKPEPVTAEDLKEGADQYDVSGPLVNHKEKGNTLEYLGKEDVEGTECHKLKVTRKSGRSETLFIDPATFYIVRTISKQKANGQEADVTTNLSNYTKLPEGILVPMSIALPFGELKLTKVEINKPVDEKVFKPDTN